MTDSAKLPIIEKLRKLQALAERAGTEGEAATAMLRVQELLAKHNLDIGVLELKKEDGVTSEAGPARKSGNHHVEILAQACDQVLNVRHYIRARKWTGERRWREQYVFLGLQANVDAACMTFSWLVASVESLVEGFKRQPEEGFLFAQWTRKDYDSFRVGAAVRIKLMAEEQSKSAQSNATAELIHVGNAVAERMHKSLKLQTRVVGEDTKIADSAFIQGYVQGARVDFHGARKSRMVTGGDHA